MRDTEPGLREQLAARLRRETTGEVLFSRADRGRYATDASIYQIEPIGVLVPRTIERCRDRYGDRARERRPRPAARRRHQPMRPDGQPRLGHRLLEISAQRAARSTPSGARALVEPGIVLGHLNAAL